MHDVKKTFLSSDGTRKVEVFQGADNTFGFEELKFWQEEQAWLPVGKYSIAIVDSLDRATQEAKGRVSGYHTRPNKAAADGAIGCSQTSLFLRGSDADRAPQLKASVRWLHCCQGEWYEPKLRS